MAYNPKFLSNVTVSIPAINKLSHPQIVSLTNEPEKTVLDYKHHSVVLNKQRRLAIVSACNIDGGLIPAEKIPRKGSFRENKEIPSEVQLGETFYEFCGSIIDKGHLTKYEDVIWGKDLKVEDFVELGRTTNFYPNAVPQHRRMNRGKWSSLELYILDTETDKHELKVCMFTGPVLNQKDPVFIHKINGTNIQLPVHFWKIVVYKKKNRLYALGFMMSHKTLLEKTNLVRQIKTRARVLKEEEIYFNDFKHSKPYQVMVEQIEELAGIKLEADKPITKPFKDSRPLEVLSRDIDVRSLRKLAPGEITFLTPTRFSNLVTE